MQFLKRVIKQNVFLTSLVYIIRNIKLRIIYLFDISTDSGSTHAQLSVSESVDYIEGVFKDYQRVSGIEQFSGRIAEIGPGDSAGVALLFVAHGADHVDLADRFYSRRSNSHNADVYQVLSEKYPMLRQMLASVDLSDDSALPKIKRFYGEKASGELFFKEHNDYSVIVSRSVLEHVDDPELVLRSIYDALKPGGVLIHKVDLRDHGMFTPYRESTAFLRIPRWVYRLMTWRSGYPNRFLFHDYKRVLQDICPDSTKLLIAAIHGRDEPLSEAVPLAQIPSDIRLTGIHAIEEVRHKFASCFKHVPSDELMVSSFFFICEKPKI